MGGPAMANWLQRRLRARGLVPRLSETERIALEAGDVWVDGDIFSGRLHLDKLLEEPYPELSSREVVFLEGPVEELCDMVDDWRLWRERQLPRIVWNTLREHCFFGLNIPAEYGGLGFSALGQRTVFGKLTSRSADRNCGSEFAFPSFSRPWARKAEAVVSACTCALPFWLTGSLAGRAGGA